MKSFIIKVPIYDVIIYVRVSDKSLDVNDAGMAAQVKDGHYVILLAKSKKSPRLINSMTHEVMHVVWHILARAGFKLCEETQEAYCYLTGYINEQIYKKL